jgi:hypothetical protein
VSPMMSELQLRVKFFFSFAALREWVCALCVVWCFEREGGAHTYS